jgi:transposase
VADSIEIPLGIDDFSVIRTEVVDGVLEAHVRSTFPTACWHCGSTAVVGHGRHLRRVRDRSCGQPTVLVWHQRRFACRDCGRTSRERHTAVEGARSITRRFRRQLFTESCRRPFSEVASDHGVSAYRVVEAFDAYSVSPIDVGSPRVLAMDESSFRKRWVFQTVLFDPVGGRALSIADGRDQRAAAELLFGLSAQVRAGVETLVVDCHPPFLKAAAEALPGARVVVDKFHVLRSMDEAAAKVRRRAGHKKNFRGRDGGISRQHNPRNDPAVYRLRWAFARRRHGLSADEWVELEAVFDHHATVAVAWWMKEAFAAIYEAADRTEAERRLATWEHNLAAAGLKELSDCWRNLSRFREEILAYFDDRQTNGYAEGVTNKIKVMKRRSYGFANRDRYRRKVLLTCCRPGAG